MRMPQLFVHAPFIALDIIPDGRWTEDNLEVPYKKVQ